MHTPGYALHVEHITGPVIDMTENKQPRVIGDFVEDAVSLNGFQCEPLAQQFLNALHDIDVGRKYFPVGQANFALCVQPHCGNDGFE